MKTKDLKCCANCKFYEQWHEDEDCGNPLRQIINMGASAKYNAVCDNWEYDTVNSL